MSGTVKDNELAFREWLKRQYTAEGLRRYTDTAVVAYSHALHTYCSKIKPPVADNLFYFTDYWGIVNGNVNAFLRGTSRSN